MKEKDAHLIRKNFLSQPKYRWNCQDTLQCNATQLSIKDGKLTGPSQTVKRRVDQLVRVDSALEGLTIEACVNKHN